VKLDWISRFLTEGKPRGTLSRFAATPGIKERFRDDQDVMSRVDEEVEKAKAWIAEEEEDPPENQRPSGRLVIVQEKAAAASKQSVFDDVDV